MVCVECAAVKASACVECGWAVWRLEAGVRVVCGWVECAGG